MKAHVITGTITGGPYEDPNVPLIDVVPPGQGIVTDNPAQVGQAVPQQSERSDRFNGEKLAKWVQTGAALQKANKTPLGGFDFAALAAAMGIGATIGTSIGTVTLPLIGTVAGAVLGAVIGAITYVATFVVNLFNRPPAQWANAAPGVHNWFTAYGPQEFLDWVRDNEPGLLGSSIQDINKALAYFWLEKYGYVLTDAPNRRFYSGIPDAYYYNWAGGNNPYVNMGNLYGSVGIDYRKTYWEAWPAGTHMGVNPDTGLTETSQGLGGVWQKNWKILVPPPTGESADNEDGTKEPDTILGKNSMGMLVIIAAGVYLSQKKLR